MIWTVFFTTACAGSDGNFTQGIGVEEMFSSHDITVARKEASRYGTGILAMIPGSHINKTYLFDRAYESGQEPVSYHALCGDVSAL